MRALAAAFRIGFAHVFAYRAEAAIQLFSALIVAALNLSLWTVATRERAEIGGVPSGEMLAYVVAAWTGVAVIATRVNEDLGRRIRDGQVAADMLRPGSVQAFLYARDLGRAAAAAILQAAPLCLACALVVPMRWPGLGTWPLWALSVMLGHAVNYGLSFLVGMAAMKLGNVTGLSHLKGTLVSVFSGALIPVQLYGEGLQSALRFTPFPMLAHAPASIFLERDEHVALTLLTQAGWAVGLWLVGAWAWRRAVAAFTVAGG
ncbi:MAG: ABC-2 family transporter protein [Deltaproteobacteria bacterium]|nr:ABC-2 family transporter protein [Deltaproteobacteria bacterium]